MEKSCFGPRWQGMLYIRNCCWVEGAGKHKASVIFPLVNEGGVYYLWAMPKRTLAPVRTLYLPAGTPPCLPLPVVQDVTKNWKQAWHNHYRLWKWQYRKKGPPRYELIPLQREGMVPSVSLSISWVYKLHTRERDHTSLMPRPPSATARQTDQMDNSQVH